jgi:uroporphyrin-III C-methyltransferase
VIGKVYIVGAGPGDRRLITVGGIERLRAADVVLYDRLVDPTLLDEARPEAVRIFVGKEAGHHTLPQAAIHALLEEHARAGREVVRLKGGDPFVFGRGSEEAAYLVERGIPFEIIPGVTSAVAVPAFAGIPVSHRGIARSFSVATGHASSVEPEPDYAALVRAAGTLVILMGVDNLPRIAARLLEGGIEGSMPIAVIENGTRPDQRTIVSTLAGIAAAARDARPPAVVVVGEVVRLRDQLRWFAAEVALETTRD